jgi:hypothetical protein
MENIHTLGQVAPAPGVLTALYTVPLFTQTVSSTFFVCNQTNTLARFWVSVAIGGAMDAPSQYLYFNSPIIPYASFAATVGLSLGAGDVVRVMTDTAGVSFSIFGSEVT